MKKARVYRAQKRNLKFCRRPHGNTKPEQRQAIWANYLAEMNRVLGAMKTGLPQGVSWSGLEDPTNWDAKDA